MCLVPKFYRNKTRLGQIVAQPSVKNILWGPETKGLRPMTLAGSALSTFLGGLRASKAQHDSRDLSMVPESARVTKAEIQQLFDLDPSADAATDPLKASEQLERVSTKMIRDAIYKSD